MIPTIELDEEGFREIFERARKRIPVLFPEWTNFNTNDSGIALLELFAWLKDMQEYHLNQISGEHLSVYLKLLGMKAAGMRPAHGVVHCTVIDRARAAACDFMLPAGTRFAAGQLHFESTEPVCLYPGRLTGIRTIRKEGTVLWEWTAAMERQNMNLPLFGREPEPGTVTEFCFSEPFEPGREYGFYFWIRNDYPVSRNPVEKDVIPFAEICVEYETEDGTQRCEIVRDDTKVFLQSGMLCIRIPEGRRGEKGDSCRICLRLRWAEYDVAPVLEYLDLNPVELVQWHTLAEFGEGFREDSTFLYRKIKEGYLTVTGDRDNLEDAEYIWCRLDEKMGDGIVGEGNGFPNQKYPVGFEEVYAESVYLMIEHPEYRGVFEQWRRVDDFHASGPEDRHFVVEEESGTICFGDQMHGLAPEGEIRILGVRKSRGLAGNVKKGQIHPEPVDGKPPFFEAVNEENVTDGCRAETSEECLERFLREINVPCRAVTEQDYEQLLYRTPGLRIEKAKIVELDYSQNRVGAAVKLWSEKPCAGLSRTAVENIMRYMESRRLVGTDFQVFAPEYIHISLYLDLELFAYYRDAEENVKERLTDFFNQNQTDFGKPLLYGALYGFLDGMDSVKRIHALTIDADGHGIARNRRNDVILPPNGLAYLEQIRCSVSYSE